MKMNIANRNLLVLGGSVLLILILDISTGFGQIQTELKIKFVDYFYENASPVCWSIQGDTLLKISLVPDYERESLNRQTTHWNFRVEADSGTHLRLSISKMLNEVYNGSPAKEWWDKNRPISCYISYDKRKWIPVMTKLYGGQELLVDLVMERKSVWVARLPVYSLSDLDDLEKRFSGSSFFKVIPAGSTIEGRPLEIIRLGDPLAPHSVIIRARAHPWEPGGSWIVEGLINKFLQTKPEKWLRSYCVYIMPMANKDGVARGMTRFNVAGMDLNRKWDKLSDPSICPEKYSLEKFIEELIGKGIRPELGIDIHNDDAGSITFCLHKQEDTVFMKRAELFEKLLRDLTCFSERAYFPVQLPGTQQGFTMFEDGLYRRYGIPALVWELNANWIVPKAAMPVSDDWIRSGENLNEVFYQYFNDKKR
jgi:hypothetical protein